MMKTKIHTLMSFIVRFSLKMGDRIGLADGKQVVIMQTDCKNKRLKRMNQNQEHPRLWCGWRRGLIMYQTYASMQSYEWNVT